VNTNREWKILLIDDEEDITEVTALLLSDSGYQVETANSGPQGLKVCADSPPQIVITDIRMPQMDGLQVLEAIKRDHPSIEVIVATAYAEMKLAIRALQLDASDFITKPINHDALIVALDRAKQRYTTRKQLKDYTHYLEEGWSQATRQLMETFAYQQKLIESSMDGIVGCDERGVVRTFNKSMENLLGYSKSEVLNLKKLADFFESEDESRFRQALAREEFGGENRLLIYETGLKNRSGLRIPVQVSASAILDENRPSGLVCFFRDLRQIYRLEQEKADQARILHQDKMMSLGRLAASVAHEINNPLSGILNYIRLMIRALQKGALNPQLLEKFQRYLDLVEKETDRCSKIVSSLLTFSRKSPVTVEPVNVAEMLKRCIVLSQHKLEMNNIRLTVRITDKMPPVTGDFNQLQQCMINLIFNAVDAMPEGGDLMVDTRLSADGSQVVISVRDTGVGIGPADLPHIFEPFFTTKKDGYGVGLGLSTTYGIIERHKGTIKVKSQPRQGAEFEIRLPCHRP
jgi:PAS domain S-box-containing protein